MCDDSLIFGSLKSLESTAVMTFTMRVLENSVIVTRRWTT